MSDFDSFVHPMYDQPIILLIWRDLRKHGINKLLTLLVLPDLGLKSERHN